MTTDRAADYSAARPTARELIAAGFGDALFYILTSPSRAYIDALKAGGIRCTYIFEQAPNQSQQGHDQGFQDAAYANTAADQMGYPAEAPFMVCCSDGSANDPNPSNANRAGIVDYGRGWAERSPRVLCGYGNRFTTDAFNEGVRAVDPNKLVVTHLGRDGGWLPTTWGADPARDVLGQDPNVGSPVPGTDFNHVYADWWTGGDDMAVVPQDEWTEVLEYVRQMRDGYAALGIEQLMPAVSAIHRTTGDAPHPEFGIDPIAPVVATLRADLTKMQADVDAIKAAVEKPAP